MGATLLLLAAFAAEPSIKTLEWMIGDWSFLDVATEAAGFEYEERGIRSCRWAMQDQYIRCESRGGSAASARTYVNYLNYNAAAKRFEMVSMWSNYPPKLILFGELDPDGKLRLRSPSAERQDDGKLKQSWAVWTYDGKSTWSWDSGSRVDGAQADGPVRFRDVATRLPAN